MRLLLTVPLFFLATACSSTSEPTGTGTGTGTGTTAGDDNNKADASVAATPPDVTGSYVFQAAQCSGMNVNFIGYKETVTIAGGKATSVTETSGCKATISGAPVRWVSSTTFEIVYSAGTQACAPNPCNIGYDVIVGGTRSTVPPTKCENGPVLVTGGNPPRFAPSADTLQASMTFSGIDCIGQYIKL